MSDMVNHPEHYQSPVGEVIDVIERWGLGFCLGNALKYICRAGRKPGADRKEDLEKALFYIRRAINNREYCGPGTYFLTTPYSEEMLPYSFEVAEAFCLPEMLSFAVNALYNYVTTFEKDELRWVETYVYEELNGGNENE
nr:MAG TPA: nucelotide kinase [Caudoviricetes sp.]